MHFFQQYLKIQHNICFLHRIKYTPKIFNGITNPSVLLTPKIPPFRMGSATSYKVCNIDFRRKHERGR